MLLGHHEARSAFRAQKAFKACKRLSKHKEKTEMGNENEAAESEANGGEGKVEATQHVHPRPALVKPNPEMNPTQENAGGPIVQPVNFEKLAVQSLNIGQ
jgi:hypothetical protein